jgi:hypothetical protein
LFATYTTGEDDRELRLPPDISSLFVAVMMPEWSEDEGIPWLNVPSLQDDLTSENPYLEFVGYSPVCVGETTCDESV